MGIIGWIILIVIVAAIIIALAAWWYERATNEVSLLRTGVGGRHVVIDGGVLAIPYLPRNFPRQHGDVAIGRGSTG